MNDYIQSNNVRKCPKCGFGTEKIDGCNKMKCVRCDQGWCWNCNSKISGYDHFDDPVFGCGGNLYNEQSLKFQIIKKILMFIAIPFILFFAPIGLGARLSCVLGEDKCRIRSCWIIVFWLFTITPLFMAIGTVIGALAVGILGPLAILY